MDREFSIAIVMYSFANATASATEYPFARLEAIAAERVQPVP